jgi:hypothetical protein
VNVVVEWQRKRIDTEMGIVWFHSADRTCRARDEGHHREPRFVCCLRLMMNAALVAVIAKDTGRQLATRIAVDAGGIYKEIPRDILG